MLICKGKLADWCEDVLNRSRIDWLGERYAIAGEGYAIAGGLRGSGRASLLRKGIVGEVRGLVVSKGPVGGWAFTQCALVGRFELGG